MATWSGKLVLLAWCTMHSGLKEILTNTQYVLKDNLSQIFNELALFNDVTRDSIANNFVIDVYCRCLQNLYQIAFFYKI